MTSTGTLFTFCALFAYIELMGLSWIMLHYISETVYTYLIHCECHFCGIINLLRHGLSSIIFADLSLSLALAHALALFISISIYFHLYLSLSLTLTHSLTHTHIHNLTHSLSGQTIIYLCFDSRHLVTKSFDVVITRRHGDDHMK